MFPIEHNLCSIHRLVCGSALPLPSLMRDGHLFYFFLPKSLISLSSSLSRPAIGIKMQCGTLVSGSALPLPSLMRDGHLLFFYSAKKVSSHSRLSHPLLNCSGPTQSFKLELELMYLWRPMSWKLLVLLAFQSYLDLPPVQIRLCKCHQQQQHLKKHSIVQPPPL